VKALGLTLDEAQRQLTKESGLKGLSAVSNDIREIQEAAARGEAAAQTAVDVFVASARHWIGSYFLELNGADALVFTAGIGENRAELRAAICANLDQLGIVLDAPKNASVQAQESVISAGHSRVKILVIPANEELVVAREVKRFLESPKFEVRSPKGTRTPNSESNPRTTGSSNLKRRAPNSTRTARLLSTLNLQLSTHH
jgi:acetate kinase